MGGEWIKLGGRRMSRKLFGAISILAVAAVAGADISGGYVKVYEGPVEWPGGSVPYVHCYDLQVTVVGDDAWTVGAGCEVGLPWITLTGATFFQHPFGGDVQGIPESFSFWLYQLQWDTFYTTHRGFPNTPNQGEVPGIAFGPINEPTALTADWFCIPDGNFYPGTFTIARFTVLAPPDADPATTYADIDMLVGSLETVPPIGFQAHVPIPEPASVALLALGGLALLGRR
jgi:hypothetical protein